MLPLEFLFHSAWQRSLACIDWLSRALWCHRMMPHVMLLAFVESHDLLEPRPTPLGVPAPWVLRRYRGCYSLSLTLVHRFTQYSSAHWRVGLVEWEAHDLPFPLAATLLPHTW